MTQHKAITTRLDIVGFKSFADETHLDILPGLTGIIGPNGCGKSNIVEALRWTMGESSARALRGGESDDLIFAGTGNRPARNLARVTLHLSEASQLAPPPFEKADELEISRQAERGSGSTYRINNRVMRARDVQTIFADLSSGARSSSIISQNRVSQLIAAKPEERRLLLEEAAGITGLYVRRRDAELKLRQAETNLERAEEHRQTLEQQLTALSSQSEQAQLYRKASETIRHHERDLLILQHARAEELVRTRQAALQKAQQALTKTQAALEETQKTLTQHTQSHQAQENELATLRPKLEQYRIKIEVAQTSLQHQRQASQNHLQQLHQIDEDITHQKEALTNLTARRDDLVATLKQLAENRQTLQQDASTKKEALDKIIEQEKTQKAAYTALSTQYQDEFIRHETFQNQYNILKKQIEDHKNTLEDLKATLNQIENDCNSYTPLDKTRQDTAAAVKEALSLEEKAKVDQANFQEQRLAAAKAERDVQEAKTQTGTLTHRIQELTEQLEKQRVHLKSEQDQTTHIASRLLSDADKKQLQTQHVNAKNAADAATQHERTLLQQREEAEHNWLNEQATQEKQQQRRSALTQEINRLTSALEDQKTHYQKTNAALEDARAQALQPEDIVTAQEQLRTQDNLLAENAAKITDIQTQLTTLDEEYEAAQSHLQDLSSNLMRHKGEREGLQQSLQSSLCSIPHPLLEQLHIPDDLTHAVASALADGLEASLPQEEALLPDSPRQWRHLPPVAHTLPQAQKLAALPSLASLITAPPALERAFRAIFLLENAQDGAHLQPLLTPGQALVTKDGALWRWDGFIRQPNVPTTEMVRLEQSQRLKTLTAYIEQIAQDYARQKDKNLTLEGRINALKTRLTQYQTQRSDLSERHAQQRHQMESVQQRYALQQEQLTRLQEDTKTQKDRLEQYQRDLSQDQQELTSLPETPKGPSQTELTLQKIRLQYQQAHQDSEAALKQQQNARQAEQQAIFQHQTHQTRLQELHQNIAQREDDIKRHESQKTRLTEELNHIDLSLLQRQYNEAAQQLEAAQKATELALQQATTKRHEADSLQQSLDEQERRLSALQARREELLHQIKTQQHNLSALQNNEAQCRKDLEALPDLTSLKTHTETSERALHHTQETLQTYHTEHNQLVQDYSIQNERYEHSSADLQRQEEQQKKLHAVIEGLIERRQSLLQAAPAHHDADSITQHEAHIKDTIEALQELEGTERDLMAQLAQTATLVTEQRALLDHHKESEGRYKEETIRLNERLEQAEEALALLRHDAPLPENSTPPAHISAEAEQTLRRAIQRAIKQREALGPVNLCAEDEFRTAKEESDRIAKEHQDLSTAIARLRGGVGAINREGRQRLMAVFSDINQHFQKLFTRMFNGGKAHLEMVGSDDPLEAGLEIFAQPPGKKLSALSLLSGGEQALTALSLIFAAFHCTPAPICVLDEVDAPLDDANVERFCTLLKDMTQETGTRFLVVTHHQLTMAHMDRLFGITMQERGVSRLLSVDLDESIRMVNG